MCSGEFCQKAAPHSLTHRLLQRCRERCYEAGKLKLREGVRQGHRGAGFPHFFKGPRGKRGRFPGPTRWPKALVNKGIH